MQEELSAETLLREYDEAFADERLNARLRTTVRAMSRAPAASWPSVCTSAELEGLYRFTSNVRVTPADVLGPHFARTKERTTHEERVLAIHDTTTFSFRWDGGRSGLGRTTSKGAQAFRGHFSLALSGDGSRRPLGVVAMTAWTRGGSDRKNEHARWLAQIQATQDQLELGSRLVHVADREADDYFLFSELIRTDTRFVIRTSNDRYALDENGLREKLALVASRDVLVEREAQLSRRRSAREEAKDKRHPPRDARVARVAVTSATLRLQRSTGYLRTHPDRAHVPEEITINAVRVWESSAPDGCEPLEWLLLTNEPVSTAEEALAVVDHYRARWVIEEYFKALKTGCGYESRQLEEYESLLVALAISIPIAYEALRLRTLARTTPDAPASVVVTNTQLEVLRASNRYSLPAEPTARDALLAIAALGGHIKYAPDPGWLTIYRGWQKLELMTEGWILAHDHLPDGEFQSHSDQR